MRQRISRPFHTGMKLALYALPWSIPQTLEGPGAIKQLPSFIRNKGHKHVFIVTDKTLMNLHLLDDMIAVMEDIGLSYVLFDKVTPNPTDVCVEEGVALYRKHQCDSIIAFGGGSPMDCAKGIAARIARPKKSIKQLQGVLRVLRPVPTIYAVPTTAGTGSETTVAAVITCVKDHHKASINDIFLMPKYAVLDPELTVGLPPHITSTTGMDALSHAVESYTNGTYNTKLENDFAKKAVKLIYENLYAAYEDGSNLKARQNMQLAAFYAGRSFSRGCVGDVHAIGHALGGLYNTPHGVAMSALLPLVMRQYGKAAHLPLAELYDASGMDRGAHTTAEKANAFIDWIEEMNRNMQISAYPPVLERKDIDEIAERAYKEGNPLYPTPVTWSKADFVAFLEDLYQKKAFEESQAAL